MKEYQFGAFRSKTSRWLLKNGSHVFTRLRRNETFSRIILAQRLSEKAWETRKIIAWDHNRDLIYQRASTILADPKAAKFVWGIGYHWYEPWSGGEPDVR